MRLQRIYLFCAVIKIIDTSLGGKHCIEFKLYARIKRFEYCLGILVSTQPIHGTLAMAHLTCHIPGKVNYREINARIQGCPGIDVYFIDELQSGPIAKFQIQRKTHLLKRLNMCTGSNLERTIVIIFTTELGNKIFPFGIIDQSVLIGRADINFILVELSQLTFVVESVVAFLPLVCGSIFVEEVKVDAHTDGSPDANLLFLHKV